MARPPKYKITEEDIDFLREVYPTGDWDAIKVRFPGVPRSKIYHVVSANNITMDNYFWTQHDKDILIQYYNDVPTEDIKSMLDKPYTIRQIQNQAIKLGLTKSRFWTDDEVEIMLQKYSELGAVGLTKILPNKSHNAILGKARAMGLQCNCYWSEKEEQFVRDNWEYMSDQELARELGRGVKGVSDKRRALGLYYKLDYNGYYTLINYIRMNISSWKKESMKACGYKCVLTGGDFDDIHHKYGFNLILNETLELTGIDDRESIDDYTDDELLFILNTFKMIQDKYPLGVCVSREVHKLFHSIYGYGNNTPDQWDEFEQNYKKGIYQ